VTATVAASSVFGFHLAQDNLLNAPPGQGRGAAYGYSIILEPLSPGVHTVEIKVTHWHYRHVTYTVNVGAGPAS
jgi:hypothetical protein